MKRTVMVSALLLVFSFAAEAHPFDNADFGYGMLLGLIIFFFIGLLILAMLCLFILFILLLLSQRNDWKAAFKKSAMLCLKSFFAVTLLVFICAAILFIL